MDEMKSKVLDAGLMAIGAAIPVYEKLRETAEAAGDTPPGRLVGGALKLVEPLAKPVLGLIPGFGGHDGDESPRSRFDGAAGRSEGYQEASPARPTSATATEPDRSSSSGRAAAKSPAATSAKTPKAKSSKAKTPKAKSPAGKKTSAKKTAGTKSPGKSAAKGSTPKGAGGKTTTAKPPARRSSTASPAAPKAAPEEAPLAALPLPTYTHLKMPAILDALNGLTKPQLSQIREYEVANENRGPILDRIDELLAVPLPGE